MSDESNSVQERPHAPIEVRQIPDFEVRHAERVIELVAMPYDQDAIVEVRGRTVIESCAPGAFEGIGRRASRIGVYRDHAKARDDYVGRSQALHPSRAEGLVAELRIARGDLGDQTLEMAEDGLLDASVGFAVMPGGERWLENRRRRRLERLFVDHIAMVPEGAYEGARVLAVRAAAAAETPQPVATPNLDEVLAWFGR
jgi:phage head maturation protease